ncbi:hypothetical protein [Bordetella sp. N]|uniref:hypothetical protein n=1 Tax=Bordetella sp. N TaxID=1746199 RepID=UPI00070B2A3C|nr:hypothetical protein [Bordetella sp. N]ALM82097.1 hypothetical protein ASB57_03170 [Bordetella sp. N]
MAADSKFMEMDTPKFEITCAGRGADKPYTVSFKWDGKTLSQPFDAIALKNPDTFAERTVPGDPSPTITMRFTDKGAGWNNAARFIVMFGQNDAVEAVGWTYTSSIGDRQRDAKSIPFDECSTTLTAPK